MAPLDTTTSSLLDMTGASDMAWSAHYCQSGPKGDGVSMRLSRSHGDGGFDLIPVNSGIVLALSNFVSYRDEIDSNPGKDVVKIHFQLKGRGAFDLARHRSFTVEAMMAGILFHPQGMKKHEHYPKTDWQAAVTLFCDIDFLRETLQASCKHLPKPVRASLYGNVMDFLYLNFPISHEMALAAQSLLHYRHEPGIGKLQLQAKSFELLYEFFRRMEYLERSTQGHPKVTASDREKVDAARACLERDFVDPPTLSALAHRLGTNEAKLADNFKAQYGMTVFDYLQKVRMDNAQNLLRRTDLSVTQVALEVGYGHPSNFTTAFKRYTGTTPREFRRH